MCCGTFFNRSRALIAVSLLVPILVLFGAPLANAAGNTKVEICHIPPGNPLNFHTIRVAESAVPAHLAHGDFAAECGLFCETQCDDGDLCTQDDCDASTLSCLHTPADCDDSNPCTTDSCPGVEGCEYEPVDCGENATCDPDTGDCVAVGTCPCEGLSAGQATWDSSFNTGSCDAAGASVTAGDTTGTQALAVQFAGTCTIAEIDNSGNIVAFVIQSTAGAGEELACVASLNQIAAEDGVVCE